MNTFEEATLRDAEADAKAIRASARADASRRLQAAEAERREILTHASFRRLRDVARGRGPRGGAPTHEALIIREASVRNAMEESGRLRDEAMAQARQIIEDAANEAAKLITTMNMEREHILADARDDARRIIDEARESTAVDAVPTDVEPTSEVGDRTADEGTTDAVDTTDVADIPPTMTKTDDEWLRDLERLFEDDTTSPRAVPAEPPQRRPRPRWYHH